MSHVNGSSSTQVGAGRTRRAHATAGVVRGACQLAALGDSPQAAEWISLLARPGDLIQVARASRLAVSGAEHGLVFAEPKTAGDATQGLRVRRPDAASTTMLVCQPRRQHPHQRLVLTPLESQPEAGTTSDATSLVFAVGADGTVWGANRGFAEAVGRAPEKITGVSYSVLLGPVSSPSSDLIAQSLADGKARSGEVLYARLSFFRQVSIRPLRMAGGRFGALLVRFEADRPGPGAFRKPTKVDTL